MGELFFLMFTFFIPPLGVFLNGKMAASSFNCDVFEAPGDFEPSAGYRSLLARRNVDTWKFANQCYGNLCKKYFWHMVLLSELSLLIVYLFYIKYNWSDVCIITLWGVQWVIYMSTIALKTEQALNKTFDWHGNRREKTKSN